MRSTRPDYELADEEVVVTIPGRIFDPKYTQLLIRRSDLSLADIIQLDRLQKGIRLDKATVADLRRNGLVEGRYPNVFPAGEVAAAGGKTAEYVDARGFDDDFYARKILQFICRKGSAARSEIDVWISKHLSSTLSPGQKRNKIGNLLSYAMKTKYGWITNAGGPRRSSWILTAAGIEECRRTNPKCKRKCPGGGATET